MAFAREIFQQIKNHIRFQRAEKEMDSHYTILGNTLVRISNHCTYMYVWDNYFEKNPKHNGMNIVSLVFEDSGNTATADCLVLKRSRNSPIVVNEYVFPCHGNGQYINKNDVKTIISDLLNISRTNTYKDNTSKSRYFKRVSINPTYQNISMNQNGNQIFTPNSNNTNWGHGIDGVSENKQYKTNRNMKQVIRLTESDLHRVIKESIKKILKEWPSPTAMNIDGKHTIGNTEVVIQGSKYGTPNISITSSNLYTTLRGSMSELFMERFNKIYQETQDIETAIGQVIKTFGHKS